MLFLIGIASIVLSYALVLFLSRDKQAPPGSIDLFRAARAAPSSRGHDKAQSSSPSEALTTLEDQLSKQDPAWEVLRSKCCAIPLIDAGNHVNVLESPRAFFEHLSCLIAEAEHRIFMSSLYVGDGALSKELMNTLEMRVDRKIEELKSAMNKAHEHMVKVVISSSYAHQPRDEFPLLVRSKSNDGSDESQVTAVIVQPLEIIIVLDFNRMHDRSNLCTMKKLMDLGETLHKLISENDIIQQGNDEVIKTHVRLFLFQPPSALSRYLSPRYLPRAREVLAVQHTKLFSFDDRHVIATGANLSDDYFKNRIDRYVVIRECEELALWYRDLVITLSEMSYEAVSTKPTSLSPAKYFHARSGLYIMKNLLSIDPIYKPKAFKEASRGIFLNFVTQVTKRNEERLQQLAVSVADRKCSLPATWVFPTLQFGHDNIYHDSRVLEELLDHLGACKESERTSAEVFFTSPYLNVYPELVSHVTKNTNTLFTFITAGLKANGWGSYKGVLGVIPKFYLQLTRAFYYLMRHGFDAKKHTAERVRVRTFEEEGKTYHAKGFWARRLEPSGTETKTKEQCLSDNHLSLAAYGSNNYGYRSVHFDAESGLIVVSHDAAVQRQMENELKQLLDSSAEIDEGLFTKGAVGRFQPVIGLIAHIGQKYL